MSEKKTEIHAAQQVDETAQAPITGFEFFQWPETQALLKRLNFNCEKRVKGFVIEALGEEDAIKVTLIHAAIDRNKLPYTDTTNLRNEKWRTKQPLPAGLTAQEDREIDAKVKDVVAKITALSTLQNLPYEPYPVPVIDHNDILNARSDKPKLEDELMTDIAMFSPELLPHAMAYRPDESEVDFIKRCTTDPKSCAISDVRRMQDIIDRLRRENLGKPVLLSVLERLMDSGVLPPGGKVVEVTLDKPELFPKEEMAEYRETGTIHLPKLSMDAECPFDPATMTMKVKYTERSFVYHGVKLSEVLAEMPGSGDEFGTTVKKLIWCMTPFNKTIITDINSPYHGQPNPLVYMNYTDDTLHEVRMKVQELFHSHWGFKEPLLGNSELGRLLFDAEVIPQ